MSPQKFARLVVLLVLVLHSPIDTAPLRPCQYCICNAGTIDPHRTGIITTGTHYYYLVVPVPVLLVLLYYSTGIRTAGTYYYCIVLRYMCYYAGSIRTGIADVSAREIGISDVQFGVISEFNAEQPVAC